MALPATQIHVRMLIGENAITAEAGETLYERILPELKAGHMVVLDFEGVGVIASPFLNVAIGRLLQDVPLDELNRTLQVEHVSPAAKQLLEQVLDNSQHYYVDAHYREVLDQILAEQAEDME